MNSRRPWPIFVFMMITFLPLSSANANPFYNPGNYSMAGQYPGVSHQWVVSPQVIQNTWKWRPPQHHVRQAGTMPVSHNQFRGYQFRPWHQNHRYRPKFPQRYADYQAFQYRWRPVIPQQVNYRWNAPGKPDSRLWFQPGRFASEQSFSGALPWGVEPAAMPLVGSYGTGFISYQLGQRRLGNSARGVYRPTNIKIPNHYVYRPLSPRAKAHGSGQFAESPQQKVANRYYAGPSKMPDKLNFRPLAAARQMNTAQILPKYRSEHRTKHFFSKSNVPAVPLRSPGVGGTTLAGTLAFRPFYSARPEYSYRPASGYTYQQQYSCMPPARFLYPSYKAKQPPMIAYGPGIDVPPAAPYTGYLNYPGRRYQQQIHASWDGYSNSYDGVPDSEGSWYNSGESSDWPVVSWADQGEYPLMGLEGSRF